MWNFLFVFPPPPSQPFLAEGKKGGEAPSNAMTHRANAHNKCYQGKLLNTKFIFVRQIFPSISLF